MKVGYVCMRCYTLRAGEITEPPYCCGAMMEPIGTDAVLGLFETVTTGSTAVQQDDESLAQEWFDTIAAGNLPEHYRRYYDRKD